MSAYHYNFRRETLLQIFLSAAVVFWTVSIGLSDAQAQAQAQARAQAQAQAQAPQPSSQVIQQQQQIIQQQQQKEREEQRQQIQQSPPKQRDTPRSGDARQQRGPLCITVKELTFKGAGSGQK